MSTISSYNYKKVFFLTLLFIFFLIPYSINLGGDGLSANYTFVLYPILICFFSKTIKCPKVQINLIIFFYIFLFLLSIFFNNLHDQIIFRKFFSFLIFITIFSFLFIDIDKNMTLAFKLSLITLSTLKGIEVIYLYYINDGSSLISSGKAAFGGQRFGFVYIIALWLIAFYKSKKITFILLKFIILGILLSGILLTFSRTSIIALLFSVFLFLFLEFKLKIKYSKKKIYKILWIFFVLILIFLILINFFPTTFSYYNLKIIDFIFQGLAYQEIKDLNPRSSIGYRIIISDEIINFLLKNPFLGSGYLGCWILFEQQSCSAHNQYLDIAFRVGLFGLLVYLSLLFKITKFLYINHKDLFYGFIAALIYGLFHETFKLSQGAFILAFLMSLTYGKKSKINRKFN